MLYHDACETIFCVHVLQCCIFLYLYLYGLWPEIKSYYIIIIIIIYTNKHNGQSAVQEHHLPYQYDIERTNVGPC